MGVEVPLLDAPGKTSALPAKSGSTDTGGSRREGTTSETLTLRHSNTRHQRDGRGRIPGVMRVERSMKRMMMATEVIEASVT